MHAELPGEPFTSKDGIEGRKLGRYLLFDAIGTGGMASVHIGRLLGPAGFSRTVAIKRLHPEYVNDPDFVSMFLDEARLAARIHHPNVVQVLDVVALDDQLLLVMEYVRGETLAQLSRRPRLAPIPVPIALAIATDVLYGLHAAHEATSESGERLEIVHRDISPQNILVGTDGVSKVTDFGVAKAAARASTTRDGQLKGKLAYMAPEQIQRRRLDRRTDIFGMSVVIWEMVSGRRLFSADDPGAVLGRILYETPPDLASVAPDTPRALSEIVMKGLSRDPSGRFSTAHEMATALETLGPARAAEVVLWVAAGMGDKMKARAERVLRIEQASAGEGTPRSIADDRTQPISPFAPSPVGAESATSPGTEVHPVKPRSGSLRSAALWLLGALVVSAALGSVIYRTRSAPQPEATTPAPSAPAPESAVASAPAAAAEPAPEPAPSSSAPPPKPTRVSQSAPIKSRANCNPPYVIDSRGIRVYKRECLKH